MSLYLHEIQGYFEVANCFGDTSSTRSHPSAAAPGIPGRPPGCHPGLHSLVLIQMFNFLNMLHGSVNFQDV